MNMVPIRCPETSVRNYHYSLCNIPLTHEYGTDRLSRNVGKILPLLVSWYPRRSKFSSTSRRKLEITNSFKFLYPGGSTTQCSSVRTHQTASYSLKLNVRPLRQLGNYCRAHRHRGGGGTRDVTRPSTMQIFILRRSSVVWPNKRPSCLQRTADAKASLVHTP